MFDNDNPILIDVNSRKNKKQKLLCVLCSNDKIQLDYVSELRYKCPRCKNTYQLGYEILEHEDDFVSLHEGEDVELSGIGNDSVGLLVADNEFSSTTEEEEEEVEGKIPIPKYMKSGEGRKVIEYREE
jgi:phage FluMu protein Com